jgi:hypothetical protein
MITYNQFINESSMVGTEFQVSHLLMLFNDRDKFFKEINNLIVGMTVSISNKHVLYEKVIKVYKFKPTNAGFLPWAEYDEQGDLIYQDNKDYYAIKRRLERGDNLGIGMIYGKLTDNLDDKVKPIYLLFSDDIIKIISEPKQIFSEVDPLGEEDWED